MRKSNDRIMRTQARAILILYYSGAGSTRCLAELLAERLEQAGCQAHCMELGATTRPEVLEGHEWFVLGVPVYHGAPPETVMEFLCRLPRRQKTRSVHLFATCGLYPGNTLRTLARGLAKKGIDCAGTTWFRAPASDASLFLPEWIGFLRRFERSTARKLQGMTREVLHLVDAPAPPLCRVPPKWYGPLDYVTNQLLGRSISRGVLRHRIRLLQERWDGRGISCPRNCWRLRDGAMSFDPACCEFCLRCLHRTPNRAVVFSARHRDRPRLDGAFFACRKEELRKRMSDL